jgi:hypothetical protein
MSRTLKAKRTRDGKRGPAKWIPTDKELQAVEEACAKGCTMKEVIVTLGISASTMYDRMKDYPQLADAVDRGTARSIEAVRNALFINATNPAYGKDGPTGPPAGSVEAQKFFLQSRAGDKVNNSLEVTGKDGDALHVQVYLPRQGRGPEAA